MSVLPKRYCGAWNLAANLPFYTPPAQLLREKVILVTGAGQGLGKALALSLSAFGATVVLHGRQISKLEVVYDEIEDAGGPQPAIFPLDLESATTRAFEAFAYAIKNQLGRLDGIVHNAARLDAIAPLDLQTLDSMLAILRVNLAAPFALTKACLPLLKAAEHASVIMTSATSGHAPQALWGSYAVSKAGLEALVKIWAQEWESQPHLRINAVIPGPVHTPQRSKTHPGEMKTTLRKPDDLMSAYLYLLGRDSIGVSGQTFQL